MSLTTRFQSGNLTALLSNKNIVATAFNFMIAAVFVVLSGYFKLALACFALMVVVYLTIIRAADNNAITTKLTLVLSAAVMITAIGLFAAKLKASLFIMLVLLFVLVAIKPIHRALERRIGAVNLMLVNGALAVFIVLKALTIIF